MTEPRLYTQLNNGTRTAKSDCAVMSVMMALSFGSGHRFIPTVKEIREAAGNTAPAGLSTSEVRSSLKILTDRALGQGIDYIPPRYGGERTDVLREWLQAGYFVGAVVNYELLNKLVPNISGQRTLVADHSVGMYGWESGKTLLYDPLYDGRYKYVPKTPQSIAFSVVERLTARFVSSAGHFWGYAVKAPERPTLRRGSSGALVTYAQERLRAHGRTGVLVNGGFGWRTERGVRNFQKAKGLPVNGVIEAATWRKLEEKP